MAGTVKIGSLLLAARAPKTLRPPEMKQVLQARFLGSEFLLKFQQV